MSIAVFGASALLVKLKAYSDETEKGVERGLVKSGLLVQGKSQKLVPVDTAALKNTARTRKENSGFQTVVVVSYGQNYAVKVHEDLSAFHPIGEAKYLEKAYRRNEEEIVRIVKEEAGLL